MEMGGKLYDMAVEDDINALLELLNQDPLLLHRHNTSGCISRLLLHVAAQLGHANFVEVLLQHKPELAEEVDPQKQTPLHLASARGYHQVVRSLVTLAPNICHAHDIEGRNPVHIAAIKGRLDVLEELVRARPLAVEERVEGTGETVLHLCVKYGQLDALKMLVEFTSKVNDSFVNSKDGQGNTILHLAVANKQSDTINFLVKNLNVNLNVINANGLTVMDQLAGQKDKEAESINQFLKKAGAQGAKCVPHNVGKQWVDKKREALMIVASLIATMAFQAGLTPPGGMWQDDKDTNDDSHEAGTSIMGDKYPAFYALFLASNTISLISSLSIILLLVSGLPCRRWFVSILMVTIWIAITSTTFTYVLCLVVASTGNVSEFTVSCMMTIGFLWFCLMGTLLFGHIILFLKKIINNIRASWWRRTLNTSPTNSNHQQEIDVM